MPEAIQSTPLYMAYSLLSLNSLNPNTCYNYVKIKHTNGYYTLYAHMKYGSVAVQKGDKVSKGQVIGYFERHEAHWDHEHPEVSVVQYWKNRI